MQRVASYTSFLWIGACLIGMFVYNPRYGKVVHEVEAGNCCQLMDSLYLDSALFGRRLFLLCWTQTLIPYQNEGNDHNLAIVDTPLIIEAIDAWVMFMAEALILTIPQTPRYANAP
jgi:hypothetical protein